MQVIAGTGSNDTAATIAATKFAASVGAHAALVVVPYYSRPTQAGLIAHFTAVAEQGGLNVIVYNIPGRAAVGLTSESLRKLSTVPRIVAVKDATGGLDIACDLAISAPHLHILSGDDGLTLPFISVGAKGVISVVSNLFPREYVLFVNAALNGDFAKARVLHEALLPITRACFIESNPGPIKDLLHMERMIDFSTMRLPLVNVGNDTHTKLADALLSTKQRVANIH